MKVHLFCLDQLIDEILHACRATMQVRTTGHHKASVGRN